MGYWHTGGMPKGDLEMSRFKDGLFIPQKKVPGELVPKGKDSRKEVRKLLSLCGIPGMVHCLKISKN